MSMSTPAIKPTISAVLITKNAQAHLRECLEALRWCDEIVVLDSGSTDATQAICAEFGARFVVNLPWPGFGPQKNVAINLARRDWIFSVDADEICTPELRAQIEAAAARGDAPAYRMPRLSSFCGHWMRHGGWWPDYVTRLWKRGSARFSDDLVHERVLVDGATATLKSHLLHYTYDTMEQALDKSERYAEAGAQQAHVAGKRANALGAALRGGWAFIRTYLLRRGFLDGAAGWRLALYNAHTTRLKYRKLAALSRS